MNLVLTVAEIVAPVFLIAAAGATWVSLGLEHCNELVTRLATGLAMPSLSSPR